MRIGLPTKRFRNGIASPWIVPLKREPITRSSPCSSRSTKGASSCRGYVSSASPMTMYVASRRVEPGQVRAAVAAAMLVDHACAVSRGDLGRAVGRAVVDDDDLAAPARAADALERLVDDVPDRLFLVQAGDDDGDLGLGGHGGKAPPTVARKPSRACQRARIRWPRAVPPRTLAGRLASARAVRGRAPRRARLVVLALARSTPRSRSRSHSAPGRDLGRYLVVYAQLFDDHVVYPYALVSRPPGTPLVVGGLLDAGPVVAEVGAALLYALSILAWCCGCAALRAGRGDRDRSRAAPLPRLRGALPPALERRRVRRGVRARRAGCSLVRSSGRASGRAAALGAGVSRLVLVRPVAQVLLLFALVPLLAGTTWRGRLQGVGCVRAGGGRPAARAGRRTTPCAPTTSPWREGEARRFRSSARSSPTRSSSRRTVLRRASSQRAVARDLLPYEPYRSYEIDLEEFFSSGSARMHEDLTGLSDRVWGWDDDYRHLARVGREAVLAHPGAYARGVAGDLKNLLLWPLYVPVTDTEAAPSTRVTARGPAICPCRARASRSLRRASRATSRRLTGGFARCGRRRPSIRSSFRRPADAARAAEIDRRVDDLVDSFPDRSARSECGRSPEQRLALVSRDRWSVARRRVVGRAPTPPARARRPARRSWAGRC